MLNTIVLMGRITAPTELKTTPSGTSVTSFSIAVDRKYQQKDGEKQTDFINCVAWRGTAEFICKYFDKGDMIAVVGELQSRKYTDKDGNNRTAFEVVIDQVSFCGSKNNNNNNANAPVTDFSSLSAPVPDFDDTNDLPF